MKRSPVAVSFAAALVSMAFTLRADDAQVNPIVDKAIKAVGGQEKLEKAKVVRWKAKGKVTIEGNENAFQSEATVQGLDHFHSTIEGEFNGNEFKAVSILNGDKGWRKFGDQVLEMDADALANEKRSIYLMIVPTTLLPLTSKDFKIESTTDEKVNDKPASTLKVKGPDGKDFTLTFDNESGLPTRVVAKVVGWMGEEYVQEVHYGDYKDFAGLKKATKITVKRDGEPFVSQELTEFKVLDQAPADAFAEPK